MGKESEPVFAQPQGDITQRTAPPEWLQPYLEGAIQARAGDAVTARPYISEYVQPSSAWQGVINTYQQGLPNVDAALSAGYPIATGAYDMPRFTDSLSLGRFGGDLDLRGPLDTAVGAATDAALNRVGSQFALSGRVGSPAAAAAGARAATEAAAPLRMDAAAREYSADLARQQLNNAATQAEYNAALQGYGANVSGLASNARNRLGAITALPQIELAGRAQTLRNLEGAAQLSDMLVQAPVRERAREATWLRDEPVDRTASYLAALTGFAPTAGGLSLSPNLPIGYQNPGASALGSALSLGGLLIGQGGIGSLIG